MNSDTPNDGTVDWGDIPYGPSNRPNPSQPAGSRPASTPTATVLLGVEGYEQGYKLPTLLGSPTQVAWARTIRHDFLRELLPQIIDAAAGLAPPESKAVFACLDRLRNQRDTKYWIETVRPHTGRAVAYVLSLPTAEATAQERQRQEEDAQERQRQEAQQEKQRKLQKAADSRRLNKLAEDFEALHHLPPLESPVCSIRQESFGRRCRYQILAKLSEEQLASVLASVKQLREPGLWIGAFLRGWSIPEALRRAEPHDQ